jgi:hypothetical protein
MADESSRFANLEGGQALPPSVRSAIEKLNRFDHLEIGSAKPPAASSAIGRLLCPHCGQTNEKGRTHCWACFFPLEAPALAANKPAPDQPIALVLNGVNYVSTDPHLPPHIRRLMDRIRDEGYTPELIEDWQRSLPAPAPQAPPLTPPLFGDGRLQVFKGQRVSILRLDGKLYKSDDPDLPEELREIFSYIEAEGVTPALMQHLRLYGTKVKFRPISTPTPSDGDRDFWKAAKNAFSAEP